MFRPLFSRLANFATKWPAVSAQHANSINALGIGCVWQLMAAVADDDLDATVLPSSPHVCHCVVVDLGPHADPKMGIR